MRWLRCPEDGCMLRRWHRSAHFIKFPNGVWQMWTDDIDLGATLRSNLSDVDAKVFLETFIPMVRESE